MNLLIKLTTYIRSGLVIIRYMRLSTNCLNSVALTLIPPSYFDNFISSTIGFLTTLLSPMPNLVKIAHAYLLWKKKIRVEHCLISIIRKCFIFPKSCMSNFNIIEILNSSHMVLSFLINIKSLTYKLTINILPPYDFVKSVFSLGHLLKSSRAK